MTGMILIVLVVAFFLFDFLVVAVVMIRKDIKKFRMTIDDLEMITLLITMEIDRVSTHGLRTDVHQKYIMNLNELRFKIIDKTLEIVGKK